MTTVILLAGVALVIALAFAETRPAWRIPALVFATLAIPGNVDDLLPQMTLDPHLLRDVQAPMISSVDLLLAWAVALTVMEGRRPDTNGRRLTILALVVMGAAWVTSLVAAASGVEIAAVVRGMILFARLPALMYLASALREQLTDATRLSLAVVAGGVVLLGNGVYTTIGANLDRFTARTFGRNGFAIVLVFVIVVAAGLIYTRWAAKGRPGLDRFLIPVTLVIACACLFGASATGTRMGFLVLLAIGVIVVIANPAGWSRPAIRGMVATVVVAAVVLAASAVLTTAGGRTISVITDPDTTVDVVTNPGDSPTETEIRSRGQFWDLAIQMAKSRPLTGVGPFQWNVVRYQLDVKGPVAVADAHNSYFQVAAEYGFVVLAGYLALLGSAVAFVAWHLRSQAVRRRLGWAGLGVAISALVFPMADFTNSHLFNIRNGLVEWLAIAVAVSLAAGAAADTRRGADGPSD